mgnify:FL=1
MASIFDYFGFKVKETPETKKEEAPKTFIAPVNDDGSFTIDAGGIQSFNMERNIENALKTEADAIRKYREIAKIPEADQAISDICDEAIILDDPQDIVSIEIESEDYPKSLKKKIKDEFEEVLKLLHFDEKGYDIFRKWYIDARLFYQILIDTSKPDKGILELRQISPFKIKKVLEIERQLSSPSLGQTVQLIGEEKEYYFYTDETLKMLGRGLKLAKDSICYIHSGMVDDEKGMVIGYLHKAIKPANQLLMVEDSLVIYRIARAPERRVFYIDVGNLPKGKAEEHVKSLMTKYRNRMSYDSTTGTLKDNTQTLSMMEDFWLPRRADGKSTEITTLQGAQNLGEIEDIKYFLNKLYKALNVPMSRFEGGAAFNIGRSSEISRDELKFSKFVGRLRQKFAELFFVLLRIQLILKKVIKESEWDDLRREMKITFATDSYFSELKDSEIMKNRLDDLAKINEYAGTYYSKQYIRKNILHQSEDEIEEIDSQIEEEAKTGDLPEGAGTQPGMIPGSPTQAQQAQDIEIQAELAKATTINK